MAPWAKVKVWAELGTFLETLEWNQLPEAAGSSFWFMVSFSLHIS